MLPCWSVCVSVGQLLTSQLLLRQLYQIMQKGPWSTEHVCAPAWARRAHARSSLRDPILQLLSVTSPPQFVSLFSLCRPHSASGVPKNNDQMTLPSFDDVVGLKVMRSLKAEVASVRDDLRAEEATMIEMREEGTLSCRWAKAMGCSCRKARAVGFSAAQASAAGYSAHELMLAGFAAAQVKAAGFSVSELKEAGFELHELKAGGLVEGLKEAGYSCKEAKAAGYSPREIHAAGFTPRDVYRHPPATRRAAPTSPPERRAVASEKALATKYGEREFTASATPTTSPRQPRARTRLDRRFSGSPLKIEIDSPAPAEAVVARSPRAPMALPATTEVLSSLTSKREGAFSELSRAEIKEVLRGIQEVARARALERAAS